MTKQRLDTALRLMRDGAIMDRVNWNLLRIFAAIGEERGVTRAAAALELSQPAVSQALRKLEAALGTPLLRRTGRDFELTPTGAAIHAKAMIMWHASERITALTQQSRSWLEIGIIPNLPSELLDEAFRLFHQRQPGNPVRIDVMSSMEILARMRATGRGVGICLLSHPVEDLDCRLLFRHDWSVFCGVEHPFFGRAEISLDELRPEPFVAFTCASSQAGLEPMDTLSRELGLGANIIATSTSAEEVRRMIVAGLGLGVLSWITARPACEAGQLWPLRITQETLEAQVYLVSDPRGGDPVASNFVELVTELQPFYPSPS